MQSQTDSIANTADISVIIPCHNEALRLPKTIEKIHNFFSSQGVDRLFSELKSSKVKTSSSYHLRLNEIILVENGSTDSTLQVISDLSNRYSDIKINCLVSEKGKGNAVKKGVSEAGGTYLLIMDADSSTDISVLLDMQKYIFDYDIINTSRRLMGTKIVNKQSLLRRVFGSSFHLFVRIFLRPKVTDTQNGFKLFKTSAAKKIFAEIKTSGWVSELELFLLAKKRGYTVFEIPVNWSNDSASTMKFGDVRGITKDMGYILFHYTRFF